MSTYGMSTSIIAPASLNWMPLKDASIGTKMSYKSIKNKPIAPQSGGETALAGNIKWESIGFTGRVSSTPRYTPDLGYTIENVGDALGTPPAGGWSDEQKRQGMLKNISGKIGLRRVGVNCLLRTGEVSLNGAPAIRTEIARDAELYAQTCNPEDLAVITPASAPDEYCYFDSLVSNNPLKDAGDTPNILNTRGLGGRYEYVVTANPATHEVKITVKPSAMIMANPFQYREKTPTPFPSLSKFEMTLTLHNLLNLLNLHHKRIDPAMAGGAIGDEGIKRHLATVPLTVKVDSARHKIVMESYEESELLDTPSEVLYNCPEVETVGNSDSKTSVAPGAKATFRLNETRIMRGVPTRLLVVAKHRRADSDVFSPTRYAVPGAMTLDVDNVPALYAGMDATQRYEENVKAGFNGSFATYQGLDASVSRGNPGAGGVVAIEFNSLPLGSFIVPNVLTDVTVGGTFEFTNQLSEPSTIDFVVYEVHDNFMLYKDGVYSVFRPTISKEDVAKAKIVFADDEASRNSVRGGSWYGDMWNTFRRFINSKGARAGIRSFRNVPMVSSFVGDRTMPGRMLRSVGYGGKKKKTGGKATKVGGKASKVGGALHRVGGSRASPEELDGFLFE